MNFHASKSAWRVAALSTAGGWLIGILALLAPFWQSVELKAFDVFSLLTASRKSVLPITIVGIDEASFAQLGLRWPWPRDLHARLAENLKQAGAAVIAFDVLFPEPGVAQEDDAFARAITSAGNVVLAADLVYHETANSRQWLRVNPLAAFTQAGASAGLATMTLDGDGFSRRIANSDDAFWREAIRALVRSRPGSVIEPYMPPDSMLRHIGPANTFPYVSYHQVLNGDPAIPKNFFTDQIVLIGRNVRASLDSNTSQADMFATPFLMESGMLTPGVEIHATQIENALLGRAIQAASLAQNLAGLSLAMLFLLPALVFWNPIRSTALACALACAVPGVSLLAFGVFNLWLATATPLLALGLGYLGMLGGSYFTELRRANAIRSAFTQYLSADVVEEMIVHPELLKPGGQRREVSVLFSDLAGFTGLSEKLPAETVARIINIYLNAMTQVVMAHKGTVDKFIGDAVMAFWGAPLADDTHALHATQAALAMQVAMRGIQPQLHALGAGMLDVRIGVNSGPAIVGNMGSDLRFDYTAIGDTVNLASRLEGANKAYGTGILIGSDTVAALQGSLALRPVDRIRVKGKNLPVDVFTPCADEKIIELSTQALAAFQNRDWQAARALWQQVERIAPDDPLVAAFEARLIAYEASAPPPDWDGSIALEKL